MRVEVIEHGEGVKMWKESQRRNCPPEECITGILLLFPYLSLSMLQTLDLLLAEWSTMVSCLFGLQHRAFYVGCRLVGATRQLGTVTTGCIAMGSSVASVFNPGALAAARHPL